MPRVTSFAFNQSLSGKPVSGDQNLTLTSGLLQHHLLPHSLSAGPLPEKRPKLLPLPHERVMIYVRQETEEAYTPLHLVKIFPLQLLGLLTHNTW